MDPVTLATITTLVGATKTGIDATLAVLSRAKGRDAEKAAKEALTLVSDLQTRILQLQEVAFRLQEENAHLRADIRQKEERATDRQKYKRKQVGQSTVLVLEDEPDTYYCTTCEATHGRYVPLQPMPRNFRRLGSHRCTVCQTIYQ
jgi:hypothetical protein